MEYLISGSNNTAVGNEAGSGIFTGSFNTYIGSNAGYANNFTSSANYTTVIGYSAQYTISSQSNLTNTTVIGTPNGQDGFFYTGLSNVQILGNNQQDTILGYPYQPNSYADNGYRLQIIAAPSGSLYSSGSSLFSGSVTVSGSVLVTGSVNVTTAINLKPQSPLPTGTTGSLATSGSHLYFYNGTGSNSGWALVI
jgi:hypothetical protein